MATGSVPLPPRSATDMEPHSADFSYTCPTHVWFGAGTHTRIGAALPDGVQTVLLINGRSGAADPVMTCLHEVGATIVPLICTGEPTVDTLNKALAQLVDTPVDAVVACGGGAAIDLGKAVCCALSHGVRTYDDLRALSASQMQGPFRLPCIALPTTAGTGAEVTANAVIGVPDQAAKISLRGRGLFPTVAIVDPDLLQGAPAGVVLNSGLDAVTQIFESHTSNAATPFSQALTGSVSATALDVLKQVIDTGDPAAWRDLAWVSHVSGLALANSGLGAAHGLASVIGGRFDAPHGALCGRLLGPVLRQNLSRAAHGSPSHARILHCIDAARATFAPTDRADPLSGFTSWIDANGLPYLSHWGLSAGDLPELAKKGMAASSSQKNAVALSEADYMHVLSAAL